MKRDAFVLIRGVLLMAAAMLVLIFLEALLDLYNSGFNAFTSSAFDLAEARQLTSVLNSNFNQLMAVMFTTVAIAVPLTANMYSIKFLEFFIKDPVNALALTLIVFSDLNNSWIVATLRTGYVPVVSIHISLLLATICFSLLFPYLYYLFRFLHPNTLQDRLIREIDDCLAWTIKHPKQSAKARHIVAEGIEHIANIALRSIDRADRNTAIESIHTLERVAHAYWKVKPQLAPQWFEVEQSLFLSFSSRTVEELCTSHSWVEMKINSQIRQVLSASVPKMHDLVSSIAKSLRRLGLEPTMRHDRALREMVMEYFNTFVRLALVRRDARTVFIMFDQYRQFAEAINLEYPDLVLEIAYYFEYYGTVARESGMSFVVESVAHDLGALVQSAYQTNAPNRQRLLSRFLLYDRKSSAPLSGVKKAQALLASYLLQNGQTAEVGQIASMFNSLAPAFLRSIEEDLLHIRREKYWEITERRMHLDYVPDAQREKLREFFSSLTTTEME